MLCGNHRKISCRNRPQQQKKLPFVKCKMSYGLVLRSKVNGFWGQGGGDRNEIARQDTTNGTSIGESLFTLFASLTYAYHYLMTLIK